MFFWSDNELPQSSKSLAIETPFWVQKNFWGIANLGWSKFVLMNDIISWSLHASPWWKDLGFIQLYVIHTCFLDGNTCASTGPPPVKRSVFVLLTWCNVNPNWAAARCRNPRQPWRKLHLDSDLEREENATVWRFLLRGNHFRLPQKTYQEDVQKRRTLSTSWDASFFIWDESWKPSLNPEKTGWILFLLVAHWWV